MTCPAPQNKSKKGGLPEALERLTRMQDEDYCDPDPEAVLSETLQIISDCIDDVSLCSLFLDMSPEIRRLYPECDAGTVVELGRFLGRVDFEEFVAYLVVEKIVDSGVTLDYNALALLDIKIDWDSTNGPSLSFGGLIDFSERFLAWRSPLCSEAWICWAKQNDMTQEDLEFVLGLKRGTGRIRPGDLVAITGNKKKYPIFSAFDVNFVKSGDIGKVLKVDFDEIVVEFPPKGAGPFYPSELSIAHSKVFQVRELREGQWVKLNPRLVEEASLGKYPWPSELLEESGQVIHIDSSDSTMVIRFGKKLKEGFPDIEGKVCSKFAIPADKPECREGTRGEEAGK